MSRRQMCKKSKSPQKTRDLATLAALEAKHQNLVQKINSLLPMLLVALPPFVIYSLFRADPSVDFSQLDQTTEFSKLPPSFLKAHLEAVATIESNCQDNTDLLDQTRQILNLALNIMRQTFKTHQIHCTSEMPYRILCAGPLDELRAYDKFLLANPEIAAQITHKTLKNSMIKDVKSLWKNRILTLLTFLVTSMALGIAKNTKAWQMQRLFCLVIILKNI